MTVRQAVVLGAGEGRRLRPFTEHTPKPLIPLVNVPLVEHVVTSLARAGVERVVMNAWWRGEKLAAWAATDPVPGVEITVVREPVLLGTGGGLAGLAEHLDHGPTFVTTSDVVCAIDWQDLARCHEDHDAVATMAVAPGADVERYGAVAASAHGALVDIVGLVDEDAGACAPLVGVNASCHVVEPALIARLPCRPPSCLVRDGYVPAIKGGERVAGYRMDGAWAEVGTADLLVAAHVAALRGVLPIDAALRDKAGVARDLESIVAPSARVASTARLARTVVGAHAVVEDGASLRDCVVMPSTHVASGTEHVAEVLAPLGVPA